MYFFNWDDGEPNYSTVYEDYLHMRNNGRWNDEENTKGNRFQKKEFGFICQDLHKGNILQVKMAAICSRYLLCAYSAFGWCFDEASPYTIIYG